MIMITVSTFIAVFILYLYFRGDRKNQMPEVVRKVRLNTASARFSTLAYNKNTVELGKL
jgi:hypothetical protein